MIMKKEFICPKCKTKIKYKIIHKSSTSVVCPKCGEHYNLIHKNNMNY